jgi:poly(3-hydroxybutyrate) depolymerase
MISSVTSRFLSVIPLFASLSATTPFTRSGGCGVDPVLPAGTTETFALGDRSYRLHLPTNYDKNSPSGIPLILSFHGNDKNALNQENLSQFSNEDYNPNAIAVYPNGVDGHWEGAPYANKSISDKKFTSDLLDAIEAAYCIDTSRIYASGKSIGGGFTNVLACSPEFGGRFAAFAACSGAFYTGNANNGSDCHPARSPLPFVEFHGLADDVIPYEGGVKHDASLPPIPSWFERWGLNATRNNCDLKPIVTPSHSGHVLHYSYTCNGSATQHWTIDYMGHDWPSTSYNSDNKGNTTFINATPLIMDFFSQHSNTLVMESPVRGDSVQVVLGGP